MVLDIFEETKDKRKTLVEKIGVQTQTSSEDPYNLNLRRICIGPDLYFKADGSRDDDPIHYFGLVDKFMKLLLYFVILYPEIVGS